MKHTSFFIALTIIGSTHLHAEPGNAEKTLRQLATEEIFASMDADKDSKISSDEFINWCESRGMRGGAAPVYFEKLDTNSDQSIPQGEFETEFPKEKEAFITKIERLQKILHEKLGNEFSRMDKSSDGLVTQEELILWGTSHPKHPFREDRMVIVHGWWDMNADGNITLEEFIKFKTLPPEEMRKIKGDYAKKK